MTPVTPVTPPSALAAPVTRRRWLTWGAGAVAGLASACDGRLGLTLPDALARLGATLRGQAANGAPGGLRIPTADDDPIVLALERLTYGRRPDDYAAVAALAAPRDRDPWRPVHAWLDEQLAPAAIADPVATRAVRRREALAWSEAALFEVEPERLREDLTRATLVRAVHSTRQLQEVLVGIWAEHFNLDASKGDARWLVAAYDRDAIRAHALGRFPELLRAVVTHPAMLWYLDGRANAVERAGDRPNENAARELLELHALGIAAFGAAGGYTQQDVQAAARALSGWTVPARADRPLRGLGHARFEPSRHDDGIKRILGDELPAGRGAGDVDALVDRVARHPATARHVARRLVRHFVADDPPAAAVARVADVYRRTGGDIPAMLRAVVETPAFRAAATPQGPRKLRRPFGAVVATLRVVDAVSDGGPELSVYLERMGHAPYQYPTPDGPPDTARPWLGTLMWRWHLAAALVEGRLPGTDCDLATLRARCALARPSDPDGGLLAIVLGRPAHPNERAAFDEAGRVAGLPGAVAVALAAPARQVT